MAMYLLSASNLTHRIPIIGHDQFEMDKQSKVERGCEYMWRSIDQKRQKMGQPPFLQEFLFYMLVYGWYAVVEKFNRDTAMVDVTLWNPYNVYPYMQDGKVLKVIHEYSLPIDVAKDRARMNNWNYNPYTNVGSVMVDNYFKYSEYEGKWTNTVLIGGDVVAADISCDNINILVAPVGGFSEYGTLQPSTWSGLVGQSIFETNRRVYNGINKWDSLLLQRLRDTVEPVYIEQSSGEKKTNIEDLRKRGSVLQFKPGEGIGPITPPPLPQGFTTVMDLFRHEAQKGSFTDALHGVVESGMPSGFALSQLTSSSANQILHAYVKARDFVISECDRFWLSNLKSSGKTFTIRGKFEEKLKSKDIPKDVEIIVAGDLATPKDWMERATIANSLKGTLDEISILDKILFEADPQDVKRRLAVDRAEANPVTQNIEMIKAFSDQAKYLAANGDNEGAELFQQAANALRTQLGIPPPGSASPLAATEAEALRAEAAPRARPSVPSQVVPPEITQGFSPAEARAMTGRGKIEVPE